MLSQTSGGFLVGSSLTLADVGIMEILLAVDEFYGENKLNGYANIKVMIQKVV